MKIQVSIMCIISGILLTHSEAFADANCKAIVTKDIHSNMEGQYETKKGEVIEYINLYKISDTGIPESYAVHGGGIYPSDSVKLLNCHIAKLMEGTTIKYRIVLDDNAENSKEIIRSKIEDKLEELGMDHADASNASYAYINNPNSACGIATRDILNGSPGMVDVVVSGGICQPVP